MDRSFDKMTTTKRNREADQSQSPYFRDETVWNIITLAVMCDCCFTECFVFKVSPRDPCTLLALNVWTTL